MPKHALIPPQVPAAAEAQFHAAFEKIGCVPGHAGVAWTAVEVAGIRRPGAVVELRIIAALDS